MNTIDMSMFAPHSEGQGAIVRRRGMWGVEAGEEFLPLPVIGGAYGTLQVLDSLGSSNASIVEIGETTVWNQIAAALAAHNAITAELNANFVDVTTDRRRRYGGNDEMVMDELDEYGRADAQKVTAASDVDFPLRKYGASMQWTRDSLEVMSGAQLAANVTAIMDADQRMFSREIKKAIFRSANYTVLDRHVDNTSLAVKRLVNADSAPIPLGPNGETFTASSHTHYLFTAAAAATAAEVAALILTVIEHNPTGTARIYINRAQETAVRALTGFTAYLDARLVNIGGATGVETVKTLADFDINNREIGLFSSGGVSAVVTVKPWIPSGYLFAWVDGGPTPIVRRIRNTNRAQLRLVADDEAYPLRARSWEREHGFGIWNRTNGAVLFIDAGAAGAYVDPTITQ